MLSLSLSVAAIPLMVIGLNILDFVVMENVFPADLQPNEVYDLKGSWVGRYTHYGVHSGKVMKDMDLKRYIIVDKATRTTMLKQMDRDTAFLERCNVMDYSLLMGIY